MKFFLSAAAILALVCCSIIAASDDPAVKVEQGTIVGKRVDFEAKELDTQTSVDAYFSIPYAEAPVGPLRFKPPVPKKWSGELNAEELGNACQQTVFPTWPLGRQIAEDCLSLDVFVPVPKPSKAAVMLWIHGGGYSIGTGTMQGQEAYAIVALGEVIVVAINYRLGPFGFLSTGDDVLPGNMGMLDQVEAMKWVQDNIAAFGGDPDKVTIFGESAGGGSVSCHTLSPLSKGLFSRAIMQSGVANSPWAANPDKESNSKRAFAIGQLVNCTAENSKQLVECLMDVSADDLDSAELKLPEIIPEDPAGLPYAPVVDEHFLHESPSALIEKRLFHPVDMMVGFNADEGALSMIFLNPEATERPRVNRTEFEMYMAMNKIQAAFDPLKRGAMEQVYFDEAIYADPESADHYDAASQIIGDHSFGCSSSAYISAVSEAGVGQTYLYYFSHRPSQSLLNATWSGAGHAEELPFFGFHFLPDSDFKHTPEEVVLSASMIRYWTNFAKTGNPNMASEVEEPTSQGHDPEWPQFTVSDPMYRELSTTMKTGRGLKAKQCTLWNDYLPKLEAATVMKEDKDQECTSHYAAEDEDKSCTDDVKP